MKKQRKIELQRAITEIENPYPKDDLILSYADFLKVRDYLGYYQFNPIVFDHLVNLANDHWNTEKRISRLSLLQKVKQYYLITQDELSRRYFNRNANQIYKISVETRKLLFNLFKKTFEESNFISQKQLSEVRKICNNIMINLELTATEEEWLCSNFTLSDLILNRVLRYPIKSAVISNWAQSNYQNNNLINRRAELASWIIDQEPSFEIAEQILLDDFEYLNKMDMQAIQSYEDELAANRIVEQEFGEFLPKKADYSLYEDIFQEEGIDDLPVPELNLSKRPYLALMDSSIDISKEYPVSVPDFKVLKLNFHANLAVHQKINMIWAIAYARLDNKIKYSLLKKYYCNETYNSMYRVCTKTKNLELLKWMLSTSHSH